jgi:RimJ/RimL family protein N-acetyltransferase
MQLLWGDDTNKPVLNRMLADFVAARSGMERPLAPPYTTLGMVIGENVIGACVFHNWYPEHGVIEISAGATDKRWLSRKSLHAMMAYPFDQLGAQLVVCRVSERNEQDNQRGLKRLLYAFGFQSCIIPRLRGREESEIVFTLTDDAWRAGKFATPEGNRRG